MKIFSIILLSSLGLGGAAYGKEVPEILLTCTQPAQQGYANYYTYNVEVGAEPGICTLVQVSQDGHRVAIKNLKIAVKHGTTFIATRNAGANGYAHIFSRDNFAVIDITLNQAGVQRSDYQLIHYVCKRL